MNGAHDTSAKTLVCIWDVPVRLVHWMLVLLVIALFVTGKLGGNWLEWHKRAGYSVLSLVSFRFLWGIFGSHHARFVNFVLGPNAVFAYIAGLAQKKIPQYSGHNPLGAISVVLMLVVLFLQGALGLFSNDDLVLEGPYASLVSKAVSDQLTTFHKLNANLLLILIVFHVAAIAFQSFYKRENLVRAMVTGDKLLPENVEEPAIPRPIWLAWATGAFVAVVTYALLNI